jgi:glycosyltransferase involved in cell wall biosynthesis
VSTPELQHLFSQIRPDGKDRLWVCGNGIDPAYWPEVEKKHGNDGVVRFLWAGSNTHQVDMEYMRNSVLPFIRDYKGRALFVFVGWWPTWVHEVKQSLGGNAIRLIGGCNTEYWGVHLAERNPDVCWAPLEDCAFNRAKSELKVLEAWALGAAFVGSAVAPYQRAVTHGKDGLLVRTRTEWSAAFRSLMNPETRLSLARAGRESLVAKQYMMDKVALQWERAILLAAKHLRRRPECTANVARRLKEIGE